MNKQNIIDFPLDKIKMDLFLKKIKVVINMTTIRVFECTEEDLHHEWKVFRTFLGFPHSYKCKNCGIRLSKKEFKSGKYKLK